jgi:tricorn protease
MLRFPDVSDSEIVFSYANDLWLVPREGGVASPLASPDGGERFAKFSPDGKSVAFVGNYDGDTDLYTISTVGGFAQRVTHHPSNETLQDWLPNGELLFFASGLAGLARQDQIFQVPVAGGMPIPLPVPYGTVSSISGDGKWLAYTPRSRDGRTWKRYRGGLATDIWLFNLETKTSEKITDWEGTDTQPMWHGGILYYLSDAGSTQRLNLWKYDPERKKHSQITRYEADDIKWPSMGPGKSGRGEIVFQLGHDLMLYDLAKKKARSVEVRIPGERIHLRPHQVDASDFIQGWDISPSGKRATVQARGDIWTLASENGAPRNLTHTTGTAERSPAWSPDGRWVAYFSDASGEYEIHLTQSDGKGETRALTDDGGLFKLGMAWAPDSKTIVSLDCGGVLWHHDVETGTTKQVDDSPFGFWIGSINSLSFSHDSRWIAYARATEDSAQTSIWIYDTNDGSKRQVTSGFFSDGSPVFDRKGKYLFYTSTRRFSPTYSDVDSSFIYENSQVLLAVPLQADAERLWEPENDEVTWDDESEEDEGSEGEADEEEDGEEDEDGEEESEAVDDGLSGTWEATVFASEFPPEGMPLTMQIRLHEDGSITGSLTIPTGNASITGGSFDAASGKLHLEVLTDDGGNVSIDAEVSEGTMKGEGILQQEGLSFTFEGTRTSGSSAGGGQEDEEEEEAAEEVLIDFEGFEARAIQLPIGNGNFGNLQVNHKNHLIYARRGSDGGIKLFDLEDDKKEEKDVGAGGGFTVSADGKKLLLNRGRGAAIQDASAGGKATSVSTSGMQVLIDPSAEWPQLFTDAWRLFRDFFYDPNMHGVDWQHVHDHYAAMIPFCASREDVTYVIGEMIAEANVGHAYLAGNGDGSPTAPNVGVGMLGVDFVLENGAYRIGRILRGADWDSDAISPLAMPGVDVAAGDYLLAVNGVPVDPSQDPWASFVGLANKEVLLTVNAEPTMDEDARDVLVKTLGSERGLRYRDWIEQNRRYVEEQSGGRLGYLYVPDTGINGQNDLFRQFYGQILKDGLIIDERWNGGGQIPTRFIELLNRPATNYWATRGKQDIHWPPDSHQGPKCMLINEDAGSGGDAFPAYFRRAGLGKLIGRRTWGGLVGISGNPQLIDGGAITIPTFAYYDTDGTWGIEGHGVDPDIEVMDDPALMLDGGDPQLDVAIAHMMQELEDNPYVQPKRPDYPDRSGIGVTEEDK